MNNYGPFNGTFNGAFGQGAQDFGSQSVQKVWRVSGRQFINNKTSEAVDCSDIACCVKIRPDIGFCEVMKVGTRAAMETFTQNVISGYASMGCAEMAAGVQVLSFQVSEVADLEHMGIHQTCTILNWLYSRPGTKWFKFLQLSPIEVREFISDLRAKGF